MAASPNWGLDADEKRVVIQFGGPLLMLPRGVLDQL